MCVQGKLSLDQRQKTVEVKAVPQCSQEVRTTKFIITLKCLVFPFLETRPVYGSVHWKEIWVAWGSGTDTPHWTPHGSSDHTTASLDWQFPLHIGSSQRPKEKQKHNFWTYHPLTMSGCSLRREGNVAPVWRGKYWNLHLLILKSLHILKAMSVSSGNNFKLAGLLGGLEVKSIHTSLPISIPTHLLLSFKDAIFNL